MRTCWYGKWGWKYCKNTLSLVWKQLPLSYFWAISTSCLALKQEAVRIITITMFKFLSFLKPWEQVKVSGIATGRFLLSSDTFYHPHLVLFWPRIPVNSKVFSAEGLFRNQRLHSCLWQSFGRKGFLSVLYSWRIWLRGPCLTVSSTYNYMNHDVCCCPKAAKNCPAN